MRHKAPEDARGAFDPNNDNIYYQGKVADNGRSVELTINSQEDMQGLSDEDFKNKMLEKLKSFKDKKIPNKTLKGDIEIRTSSIKKYKSFFADKNKRLIVPYIPGLLEKARFISENTYTPETEKNIVAYWKADLLISIDKDTYNVHLTVKEDDKGNFFWDAQVNEEARRTVSATNPSVGGLTSEISEDALNITPIKENVKPDYQNKPQPKGLFDANKGVIKIFESADFSTLPHELAHYWLDNMWRYVRSDNASEKYRKRWNVIANWLNVKQEQAFLTRGQQEKFARGYEQYLLNGNLPTPIIKGAFDDYDRWLKRVYGDMNRLNVRHIDYKKSVQVQKGSLTQPLKLRKSSLHLVVEIWELDLMDLAFGRENVNAGYLMAGRIKFLT